MSRIGSLFVIFVVYVEDVFLVSNSTKLVMQMTDKFKSHFEIITVTKMYRYLGITVEDYEHYVKLHDAPMTERMLKIFKMENCRTVSTPLPAGFNLNKNKGNPLTDETPYRQLINAIFHLAEVLKLLGMR